MEFEEKISHLSKNITATPQLNNRRVSLVRRGRLSKRLLVLVVLNFILVAMCARQSLQSQTLRSLMLPQKLKENPFEDKCSNEFGFPTEWGPFDYYLAALQNITEEENHWVPAKYFNRKGQEC